MPYKFRVEICIFDLNFYIKLSKFVSDCSFINQPLIKHHNLSNTKHTYVYVKLILLMFIGNWSSIYFQLLQFECKKINVSQFFHCKCGSMRDCKIYDLCDRL